MPLNKILFCLTVCLISLISAAAVLATADPATSSLPAIIGWLTVSAALVYCLLCCALITYFRLKQRPAEGKPATRYSIETNSNAGEPIKREDSTFHFETESFREAMGLNGPPRSPETVLHYPLRSSFLRLPALEFHDLLSSPLSTPSIDFSVPSPVGGFDIQPAPSPSIDYTVPSPPADFDMAPTLSPLSSSLPSVTPSPTSEIEVAKVQQATVLTFMDVGRARQVYISPPLKGKGKAKVVRNDSTRKAREATRKALEGLGKGPAVKVKGPARKAGDVTTTWLV